MSENREKVNTKKFDKLATYLKAFLVLRQQQFLLSRQKNLYMFFDDYVHSHAIIIDIDKFF